MRDPRRIGPVLDALRQAWEANPDFRLGQLVAAAAGAHDPFYCEEHEIVAGLRAMTPAPHPGGTGR